MPASIRERLSSRGMRYQVVWRRGGPGARGQKIRTAGTFATREQAERVRDEVGEWLAKNVRPTHSEDETRVAMQVYIAELGGLLKIGISKNPARRCNDLHAVLLHVEPGGAKRERELHDEFAHLRDRGEFFRPGPTGDIRRYIRNYRAVELEAVNPTKGPRSSVA